MSFLIQANNEACGQSVGTQAGQYILAIGSAQSGRQPVVYVFDTGTQTLGSYTTTSDGIKLRGVRRLTWDLKYQEYPKPADTQGSVKNIKKDVEPRKAGSKKSSS